MHGKYLTHITFSLGNNESTEPFTSNMYNRRVLAGEFTVVNKYLLKELVEKGLWTPEVRATHSWYFTITS